MPYDPAVIFLLLASLLHFITYSIIVVLDCCIFMIAFTSY